MTNIHGDRLNRKTEELLSLFGSHAKLVIEFRLVVIRVFVYRLRQKSRIYSIKCYFVYNIRSKQHETTGISLRYFFFVSIREKSIFFCLFGVLFMLTIEFDVTTILKLCI